MVDFGDEFVIESSRIPWLVWIQILVLLLLFFLFYCFNLLTSDLSDSNTAFSASSSSISRETQFRKSVSKQKNTNNCFQQASQVGENQSIKGEIATGARGRVVEGEDGVEREGTSSKDANNIVNFLHPCYYFRLAKIAFLKCLGLELDPSEQRNES